jgi:hypothetical protein
MDRIGAAYKRKQGQHNAPIVSQLKQKITIIHPFHPQYRRQYGLVNYRRSWGNKCVDLHDEQDEIITVPIGWTDAVEPDPFVVVSAGRSNFRVEDLVRLVHLIEGLKG